MYRRLTILIALVLAIASPSAMAQAQNFPARPITMLVGLAPGGVSDVMARVYAEAVAKLLGQPVVVENKPAASGAVAAAALQNAPPDGYTLLVFSGSQNATIPAIEPSAAYDPVKGAQPITLLFNLATSRWSLIAETPTLGELKLGDASVAGWFGVTAARSWA
jgi:tripartite-type tricarboxylate transporter receptor subunit TctC